MPLTAPTITPTVIIPPYEETVVKPVRLRVGAEVQKFGYALELLTVVDPIGVVTGVSAARFTPVYPPSAGISLSASAPAIRLNIAVRPLAVSVLIAAPMPSVAISASVVIPSSGVSIAALTPAKVGYFGVTALAPVTTLTIAALEPVVGRVAARYWRLKSFSVSGSFLEVSEMQMWAGGVQLTGTPTSSSAPSLSIANLNDNSLTTRAYWSAATANNAAFWVKYDFGTAQKVEGIKLGGFDTTNRYPTAVTLEYSYDDTNWTVAATFSGLTYPGNNTLSALLSF